MEYDLAHSGFTGGSDLDRRKDDTEIPILASSSRPPGFHPGDRVIVVADNEYDYPTPECPKGTHMAGHYGFVTKCPQDDPDCGFVEVVLTGANHDDPEHVQEGVWPFLEWELDHAD